MTDFKRGDLIAMSIHGEAVVGVALHDSLDGYGLDIEMLNGAFPMTMGRSWRSWKTLLHATAADLAALTDSQRDWLNQKTQQLKEN